MGLSDIAAGIEVTAEQRDRGVPTVDDTGTDLDARLQARADDLPCAPEAAAAVLETYAAGASVGECARGAGVAPVTASKVLHRCGETGVSPLSADARRVVRDWIAGRVSRADAVALTGASEAEFALATYVETHDSVTSLAEAYEGSRSPVGNASVEKRDALAETMSSVGDLR